MVANVTFYAWLQSFMYQGSLLCFYVTLHLRGNKCRELDFLYRFIVSLYQMLVLYKMILPLKHTWFDKLVKFASKLYIMYLRCHLPRKANVPIFSQANCKYICLPFLLSVCPQRFAWLLYFLLLACPLNVTFSTNKKQFSNQNNIILSQDCWESVRDIW